MGFALFFWLKMAFESRENGIRVKWSATIQMNFMIFISEAKHLRNNISISKLILDLILMELQDFWRKIGKTSK